MSAWELTAKAVRETLQAEYASARQGGLPNIELTNHIFSSRFVTPEHFYQICFRIAKEVLEDPYVIRFERGSIRSTVLIQFVHKLPTPVYALPAPLQKELSQLAKTDAAISV